MDGDAPSGREDENVERSRLYMVPAILMAAPLAGCIGTDDAPATTADAGVPSLPALPAGFELACPPGDTTERGGLCIGSLTTLTESFFEPYLAIDAVRPDVMAIGINGGHTTNAPDMGETPPGLHQLRYDVYFTEDGGATWRRSEIPEIDDGQALVPIDRTGAGDPALAFDATGVLHISGIVTNELGGWDVFYTSTADLGGSWSEPVLFTSDGMTDRNWITVDTALCASSSGDGACPAQVFVPWQFFGGNVEDGGSTVAWSTDGGVTWDQLDADADAAGCYTVSVVAIVSGEEYIACTLETEDDVVGVNVYHLAIASRQLHLVTTLDDVKAFWPQLTGLPDGSMVMVAEDFEAGTVVLLRSTDGGANWTEPVDVRSLSTLDDEWDHAGNYWFTADPWGAIHLVIGGSGCDVDLPVFVPGAGAGVGCSRGLVHLALDPASFAVLSETALDPMGPAVEDMRVPPSLGPSYGDHYYGLAFGPDQGMLVWTRDKGLDYTVVKPLPAGAGPAAEAGTDA